MGTIFERAEKGTVFERIEKRLVVHGNPDDGRTLEAGDMYYVCRGTAEGKDICWLEDLYYAPIGNIRILKDRKDMVKYPLKEAPSPFSARVFNIGDTPFLDDIPGKNQSRYAFLLYEDIEEISETYSLRSSGAGKVITRKTAIRIKGTEGLFFTAYDDVYAFGDEASPETATLEWWEKNIKPNDPNLTALFVSPEGKNHPEPAGTIF